MQNEPSKPSSVPEAWVLTPARGGMTCDGCHRRILKKHAAITRDTECFCRPCAIDRGIEWRATRIWNQLGVVPADGIETTEAYRPAVRDTPPKPLPKPKRQPQKWAKGDGPSSINARMRKLGYPANARYATYLNSAHWLSVKARYRASGLPQVCACGSADVQLHHKTYVRLGAERLTDLEPVCEACHRALHGIGPKKKRKAPAKTATKRREGSRPRGRRPATERQLKQLRRLGVAPTEGMTMRECRKAIGVAQSKRDKARNAVRRA